MLRFCSVGAFSVWSDTSEWQHQQHSSGPAWIYPTAFHKISKCCRLKASEIKKKKKWIQTHLLSAWCLLRRATELLNKLFDYTVSDLNHNLLTFDSIDTMEDYFPRGWAGGNCNGHFSLFTDIKQMMYSIKEVMEIHMLHTHIYRYVLNMLSYFLLQLPKLKHYFPLFPFSYVAQTHEVQFSSSDRAV